MIHQLKTWSVYFRAVKRGDKPFEVRLNDRNFKEGDTLELCEWDNINQRFTDEPHLFVYVTYVLNGGKFGIQDGYVVMGIKPCRSCATSEKKACSMCDNGTMTVRCWLDPDDEPQQAPNSTCLNWKPRKEEA